MKSNNTVQIGSYYCIAKCEPIVVTTENFTLVNQLDTYRFLCQQAQEYADKLDDVVWEMSQYEESDAFTALTDEEADAWYIEYDKAYRKAYLARDKYGAYDTVIESLINALRALNEYAVAEAEYEYQEKKRGE